MAGLRCWLIYERKRFHSATIQLAALGRISVDVSNVLQLLRGLCLVSGDARLPVGKPVAVCSRGSVAVRGRASRVCERSTTLEDRGSYCHDFGRRGDRVFSFRVFCRGTLAACFHGRAASGSEGAGVYACRYERKTGVAQ